MTISVDYSQSPYLITIPQSDLTLVSGSRYKITVDYLWQLLRDYSDSEEAMPYPILFTNVPPTASTPRIIEFNEDYYVCQFEEASPLYSVDITDGNTNFRDVEVKNQISVGTNNTTGFINPTFLEAGLFDGKVVLDVANGTPNTASGYTTDGGIIGTFQYPVDNLVDAKAIAVSRGFNTIFIIGNLTVTATDNVDDYILEGQGGTLTYLLFEAGCSTQRTTISACEVEGDVEGALALNYCHVEPFVDVGSTLTETVFRGCILEADPSMTIQLASDGDKLIHFVDSTSGSPGDTPVIFDCNGAASDVTVRRYAGGMKFINMTHASQEISIDTTGGHVTIDASCTAGTIVIRGDTKITNNGTCTVTNQTTHAQTWEHALEGTYTAEEVMRIVAAALAGKASGLASNAPVFRDLNDTKDRITATTDAYGNRTAVTVDGG